MIGVTSISTVLPVTVSSLAASAGRSLNEGVLTCLMGGLCSAPQRLRSGCGWWCAAVRGACLLLNRSVGYCAVPACPELIIPGWFPVSLSTQIALM